MNNKVVNIIGAGITGSVIARNLAEAGWQVNIYEKRNHIGGNMYDYEKDGILIHKYGPHIFHTSKENVYKWMSKYWELNNFRNIVEGYVDGKLVPIPFNFKSIDIIFGDKAEELKNKLLKLYPNQETVAILELKKNEDEDIQDMASFVYTNLFLNYTTKMWGLRPDEIDESVTARIPVILSYRNTYFNDKYEGLPKDGYTKTFERILDHENIKVHLNFDIIEHIDFENNQILVDGRKDELFVYSGPLDKLFKDKFGSLDYRSLFFSFETLNKDKFQETAVVNYPADPTMTRITEYKNMTFQEVNHKTVIGKEFPGTYNEKDNKWNEPYYPLATREAREKYQKYVDHAKQFNNLVICGRMGKYKYINMDQAIDDALKLSDEILNYEKGR